MCIWWGHASSLLWSNVSIFGIPPYQWQIVWWFYQIIVEIGHLGDPGICPVIFSGHCASLSLSAPKWMPEGAAGLGREWEKRKGLSFIRFISSTIWTNTFCNFAFWTNTAGLGGECEKREKGLKMIHVGSSHPPAENPIFTTDGKLIALETALFSKTYPSS